MVHLVGQLDRCGFTRTLWRLLAAEDRAGMTLTESCAMWPVASVSGICLAHSEARYFALGRIGRDQVADYARRKGWTMAEAERWLGPNLGYEAGVGEGESLVAKAQGG